MMQRKGTTGLFSVLIIIFFVSVMLFIYQIIDMASFIRLPRCQLLEYTLEWLPREYSRIIERFEINEEEIKYIITQGEVRISWSFPAKLSEDFRDYYQIDSWRLLGQNQNQLVIDFRKDYNYLFRLIASMLIAFGFAVLTSIIASLVGEKLKLLSKARKDDIKEEIQENT